MGILKNITLCSSLFFGLYYLYNYKNKCIKNTYKRLDKIFGTNKIWEKDLDIYEVAMPILKINNKKEKCILLIGGFRDIPYVWNELEKYLKQTNKEYYAPRTFGKGRRFIQETSYKDWIISYLEAIYILQNQYKEIDIIAFSAGSLIALYLTQFTWNCKINNLILCAPYLLQRKILIDKLCYGHWWSHIIYNIVNLLVPYKNSSIKKGYLTSRNTNNLYYALYDFYEPIFILQQGIEILKLLDLIHNNIFKKQVDLKINKLITIYPDDDRIIGDPEKQLLLLNKIHKTNIIRYNLPSSKINKHCGHVLFKEDPEIINELWEILKIYI